jgi:hypothetical protein
MNEDDCRAGSGQRVLCVGCNVLGGELLQTYGSKALAPSLQKSSTAKHRTLYPT